MIDTTRRAFVAAIPAAAVAVAIPASAIIANSADASILAAWNRRIEAFRIYNALPYSEDGGKTYTPEEAAQWAIIDSAEEVIRSTPAKTPQGAAIQLWTALGHGITSRDDEAATRRRDLAYFEAKDGELDWTDRLTLAAIRSLERMPT